MCRKVLGTVVTLLLLLVLLTGCNAAIDTMPGDEDQEDTKRILFVTDGISAESPSLVWTTLQKWVEQYGYQITLAEVHEQADKASATLNQASEGLFDIIIMDRLAGGLASEWVLRNAGYYPDVQYLCLDAAQPVETSFDNVTRVIWEDAEAYYYFGMMAAYNSRSDVVAFFGSETGVRPEMDFLAFYAGAAAANESITALYYPLENDPAKIAVETAVGNALSAGSDVFCIQDPTVAAIAAADLEKRYSRAYILQKGDIAALDESAAKRVLAAFSFWMEGSLGKVFRECLSGRMQSGDLILGWEEGALTVVNGEAYPGLMNEELQLELNMLKNSMKIDSPETLPDPAMTQAERQEKISAAGTK